MTDQPTPAGSATPKMAFINAIWRAFPSVSLGEVTEAADAILADIGAAGYQIAEAGEVVMPTITPSSSVPPCEVWIVQGGIVLSKITGIAAVSEPAE